MDISMQELAMSMGTHQVSVDASSAVKGELNAMLKHCIQQHTYDVYIVLHQTKQSHTQGIWLNAAHQFSINCDDL